MGCSWPSQSDKLITLKFYSYFEHLMHGGGGVSLKQGKSKLCIKLAVPIFWLTSKTFRMHENKLENIFKLKREMS